MFRLRGADGLDLRLSFTPMVEYIGGPCVPRRVAGVARTNRANCELTLPRGGDPASSAGTPNLRAPVRLADRIDRTIHHRIRGKSHTRWIVGAALTSPIPTAVEDSARGLGVVPNHVVHPGLLGGWGCQATQHQGGTPDETPR